MSLQNLSNLHAQVAGTAAFRLTLRFALIFIVCLLTLNLALGLGARWLTSSQIRGDVEGQLDRLELAFEQGGAPALARTIARLEAEDGLIAAHVSAEGTLLAGSLTLPVLQQGWTDFVPLDTDDDEALWSKAVWLPDGSWAAVAASSEAYYDIVELMTAGAVWTVAIALPLALLSGALLSRNVLQRLARIAETAAGVREGDLSRRAPVSGRQDEFDRLATDLNAMLDTIESLTRNLRNVSVGIAHELRTPLARVRNRLSEMKAHGTGGEDGAIAIDGGLAEIDALLTTFDALLKIGQIEAYAQRRGFETVSLSDLVTDLVDVYEPVAAEQDKQVVAAVAPGIELRGNRALLTQMISNLIENAIEHTPPGTTVTLSLATDRQGPRLVVEDDGPGIPPAEGERIFDRFHRLEHSRTTPGNGLGLSLVRSICGLHGFTVRLDPATPGARFEISM